MVRLQHGLLALPLPDHSPLLKVAQRAEEDVAGEGECCMHGYDESFVRNRRLIRKWRREGGSGRNFLNGQCQKPSFLPRYAKGTCAPFRGNLPNELISWQSSFAWRGAQSTAAKSPTIGNRLLQTCCLSSWAGGCLAGHSSEGCSRCLLLQPSATSQLEGAQHGAVPGARGWHGTGCHRTCCAGPARHSWQLACRVGMAWHRDTQRAELAPGVQGWHSVALHGAVPARRLARHSTAVPACGTGTAQQGAEQHPRAALLTPLPLARHRATRGPRWGYPALVGGMTVLPWVPAAFDAYTHHAPPPSQRHM